MDRYEVYDNLKIFDFLDIDFFRLDKSYKVFFKYSPIKVTNVHGELLGFASVHQEEETLRCSLFLDYERPERLDVQNEMPFCLGIMGAYFNETLFVDGLLLRFGVPEKCSFGEELKVVYGG